MIPVLEIRARLAELHTDSFGWALTLCSDDRQMAMDVLQMSYLKILEGRAAFAAKSRFKTWLFGVIRLTSMEQRRRQNQLRTRLATSIDPDSIADTEQNAGLSIEPLKQALRQLSERQQQVLHLVFYQELTLEAAAAVLNISTGSARTHYHRGKSRLKELLIEMEASDAG